MHISSDSSLQECNLVIYLFSVWKGICWVMINLASIRHKSTFRETMWLKLKIYSAFSCHLNVFILHSSLTLWKTLSRLFILSLNWNEFINLLKCFVLVNFEDNFFLRLNLHFWYWYKKWSRLLTSSIIWGFFVLSLLSFLRSFSCVITSPHSSHFSHAI